MHDTPQAHAQAPREAIAQALRDQDFARLASLMDLGDTWIGLPREAWEMWGWGEVTMPEGATLTLLGASPGERVVLASGLDTLAQLRQLAMASWRHNPAVDMLWWCPLRDRVVAAVVSESPGGKPRLRSISADAAAPRALEVERWAALSPSQDPRPLRQRAEDVMRQEALTRRFFKGF